MADQKPTCPCIFDNSWMTFSSLKYVTVDSPSYAKKAPKQKQPANQRVPRQSSYPRESVVAPTVGDLFHKLAKPLRHRKESRAECWKQGSYITHSNNKLKIVTPFFPKLLGFGVGVRTTQVLYVVCFPRVWVSTDPCYNFISLSINTTVQIDKRGHCMYSEQSDPLLCLNMEE